MAKKKRRTAVWLVKKQKAQAWLGQARQLLEEDQPESALIALNRLLRMVPKGSSEFFEAVNLVGLGWMFLEEAEHAYQAFTLALSGFPKAADILFHRGLSARMTGRSVQSTLDLSKALALAESAEDAELSKLLSSQLDISSHVAEDEICLRGSDFPVDRLIELEDLSAQAWHLAELEEFDEAVPILRRAIELDLDVEPYDWAELGYCLMQLDQFEEAEEALQRSLKIDPDCEVAQEYREDLAQFRSEATPAA